jgi:hypothetical protein
MPFELLSSSPTVRKEAARQLIAFVGVNTALLTFLKASGAADVELDPRSADFGQIRVGDRRYDPWGGYRPIANLIARLATQEKKSTRTGEIYNVKALDVISDFFRDKLDPATSVTINAIHGSDVTGAPYDVKKAAGDLLAPLFLQDLWQDVKENGLSAAPAAIPGLFGIGQTNYQPTAADKLVRSEYPGVENYSRLSRPQQAEFKARHPDIAEQMSKDIIAKGGDRAALEQMKVDFRTAQIQDDQKVLGHEIDWEQWSDNKGHRADQIAGAGSIVYGNQPIVKPKDAYERWLNQVREQRGSDGVMTRDDWDKVDAWVASLPEADQKNITDQTGLYGTQLEKDRRDVAKRLDDAGYFDIRDTVWSKIAQRIDGMSQYKSVDDFEKDASKQLRDRLAQRGITGVQADIIVNDIVSQLPPVKLWSAVSNDVEQAWIIQNRTLAADAVRYGYTNMDTLRNVEKLAVMGGAR